MDLTSIKIKNSLLASTLFEDSTELRWYFFLDLRIFFDHVLSR